MSCNHDFTTYVGFTETFDYCSKCDKKRSDCNEKPEGSNSGTAIQVFNTTDLPVHNFTTGPRFDFVSLWEPIPKRTGPRFDSWLPTDPIKFGTNREPLVIRCDDNGPHKYKRFVLNEVQYSNDGQTWMANAPFEPYNTAYDCPQDDPNWMMEDDEPTLNITKGELQEALNAVGTTNGEPSPQLVEALWTALENT